MSAPYSNHSDSNYPEDKVTHYPKKNHGHNKRGLVGKLEGLMNTKHFGAKHGARHNNAKSSALKKKRGESTMPF